MIVFESRILAPDGSPITCNGQFADGWMPTTRERYEFWRKREMLKHRTSSGLTYEYRALALGLIPVEVMP